MKLLKTVNDISSDIPAPEVRHETAKKNILIVDDSGFARKILKDMLENEGFHIVGEAGDGFEAIEMAKQKRPDYIFLDVAMPKLDGMGALPRILEADSNMKIIMSTAMGQKSIIVEAMKIGAIDYVLKPYKKENIVEVLNAHIEAESKNSQVISFEEEKKHYIKERTREAVVREVKESIVKKEVPEAAAQTEVAKESEPVREERPEAVSAEVEKAEEKLEKDIEITALEENKEEPSLELADGGESLDAVTEEASPELSAEEDNTEASVNEESLEVVAEEEVLEVIDEEESLEAVAAEENLETATAEEEIQEISDVQDTLETVAEEESLPVVAEEDSEKTVAKAESQDAISGAEAIENIAKEEVVGYVSGQIAPEIINKGESAGNNSGQEVQEVAARGEINGNDSEQKAPENLVNGDNIGSISGQEVIAKGENIGNPEQKAAVRVDNTGDASGQQVPETVGEGAVADTVLVQNVPETAEMAKSLDTKPVVEQEKDRKLLDKEENENKDSGTADIRKTEEDTESSVFSYLWLNRFDARNEEGSTYRIINKDNYVQNFCGLSNDGNELSEEESTERNVLFAMTNAYMNLNNRFENENVVGNYLFKPCEGIRLPTFKVFGSEWYGRDEITMSNLLRYSNYNSSQDRVYFEKNSFYHTVMRLVQTKSGRILGQDRIKI